VLPRFPVGVPKSGSGPYGGRRLLLRGGLLAGAPQSRLAIVQKSDIQIAYPIGILREVRRLSVTGWEVTDWSLEPGEQVQRKALQEVYGGRTQGGIGPSRRSPNVFVFSDPVAGEPHGYFDGWRDDHLFHYTGEGQYGDQQMKSGNASILNHAEEGRALRVFTGARGTVTYEGEFELLDWYTTDAPETGNGPVRSVIVFRLKPLDSEPRPSRSKLDRVLAAPVEEVPVEAMWTEKVFVAPSHEEYEAERREQKLVHAYRDHLTKLGHEVCRLKIVPPGEAKPIFCDLRDNTDNVLVEAKGTVTRGAIRMAIGQLADYKRFVHPTPQLAVLVPSEPREDLRTLLNNEGITVIWPDADAFVVIGVSGPDGEPSV
jgi:hypothetical protein